MAVTVQDGVKVYEVWLTPEQLATIFQVNPVTIRRALREGRLPGTKIGELWRTDPSDLDEWLTSQKKVPKSQESEPSDFMKEVKELRDASQS